MFFFYKLQIDFTHFFAKQQADSVAINAKMPITPDKMTSQVPADAITFAAVTVFFTEHESMALTEYFSNRSTNDCFIPSASISACISCGGNTDPWRDNWKQELFRIFQYYLNILCNFFHEYYSILYLVDEKSNV